MWKAFQHAPIGVILADGEGRCSFANEACCSIFGVADRGMRGFGWTGCLSAADRRQVMDALKNIAAGQEPKGHCEIAVVHPRHGMRYCCVDLCRMAEKQSGAYPIVMYIQDRSDDRESVRRLNHMMSL